MAHIKDLKPDQKNARKHNPRNVSMIETSIQQNGFGRSLLLANDGTIIAGNATSDAAASAGLEDMIIVESDGTKVIAVKRTDVEPGSQRFHNLAVADNRTSELADWDTNILELLAEEDNIDLADYFRDDEFAALLNDLSSADFDPNEHWQGMPGFENEDMMPVKQITVSFASVEDMDLFSRLIEQNITLDTKSVWYPRRELESIRDKAYVNAAD